MQTEATWKSWLQGEGSMRTGRARYSTGGGWRGRPWMVVIVGLALGMGASATDGFMGFGVGPQAWVRVLSIFLNMVIAWSARPFWLAGRPELPETLSSPVWLSCMSQSSGTTSSERSSETACTSGGRL